MVYLFYDIENSIYHYSACSFFFLFRFSKIPGSPAEKLPDSLILSCISNNPDLGSKPVYLVYQAVGSEFHDTVGAGTKR